MLAFIVGGLSLIRNCARLYRVNYRYITDRNLRSFFLERFNFFRITYLPGLGRVRPTARESAFFFYAPRRKSRVSFLIMHAGYLASPFRPRVVTPRELNEQEKRYVGVSCVGCRARLHGANTNPEVNAQKYPERAHPIDSRALPQSFSLFLNLR